MNVPLLAATFARIEPQADRFADNFYRILFDLNPEIDRLMSGIPPQTRRSELIEHIKLMVDNADNDRAIQFIFGNLGQKYALHRETFDDYSLVGAALLQSLKDFSIVDWTPEVEKSWQLIFQATANAAIEGARSVVDKDAPSIGSYDDDTSDSLVNLLPQILAQNDTKHDGVRSASKSNSRSISLLLGAISIAIFVCGGYFLWSQNRSPTNNPPAPAAS